MAPSDSHAFFGDRRDSDLSIVGTPIPHIRRIILVRLMGAAREPSGTSGTYVHMLRCNIP